MATASVSSSTSVNGSNFISALGTGSGIDIKTLATNLVEAEKQPKAALIQKAIDKNEARITGYDVVQRAVGQIKDTLDSLAQPSTFATFSASSSQPAAVSISGSASASNGAHEVVVHSVARAQRSALELSGTSGSCVVRIEPGFDPESAIPPANWTHELQLADSKPETIVNAINNSNLGYTASLVKLGEAANAPVRVVITGATGLANQFKVAIDDGGATPVSRLVSGGTTPVQKADDAELTVDGISGIKRSTNTFEGVITGATITVLGKTPLGTPAILSLARDTAPVKEKIKALVSNYNDLLAIIDAAQDPNSSVEKLGGSLVNDPNIRGIRDRIRSILMPQEGSSVGTANNLDPNSGPYTASGSTSLNGLRDLGVMIDTDGRMKFSSLKKFDPLNPKQPLSTVGDESTLDAALASNFNEVTLLFQGKGEAPGIARDMSNLLSGTGRYTLQGKASPVNAINAAQGSARGLVSNDQERMTALEDRMKGLLERYIKQFAIMDSLVGESKSTRSGVENSFKGMSNSR